MKVDDRVSPGASDATVGQVTSCAAAVHPDVDDTNDSGAGKGSDTATSLASDGPLFVTAIV